MSDFLAQGAKKRYRANSALDVGWGWVDWGRISPVPFFLLVSPFPTGARQKYFRASSMTHLRYNAAFPPLKGLIP